tara:strand:- start:71 stop:589 length:519 start_codon:yes stop_codon:yes gene_type:complete
MKVVKIIEKKVPIQIFLYECVAENINVNYFKEKIDNNLNSLSGNTNVKGGMTGWKLFAEDQEFINVLKNNFEGLPYAIPPGFMREAWGIKLEKGENTTFHHHNPANVSGILYLTESSTPLKFPDLNLDIFPKVGTLAAWSAPLMHGTGFLQEGPKYAIAFNMTEAKPWGNND